MRSTGQANSMRKKPSFVVAVPFRSVCDQHARFFEQEGILRVYATWNRRGTAGIPNQRTRLFPLLGLFSYLAARTLPRIRARLSVSLFTLFTIAGCGRSCGRGTIFCRATDTPTHAFAGLDAMGGRLFWTLATATRAIFGKLSRKSIGGGDAVIRPSVRRTIGDR